MADATTPTAAALWDIEQIKQLKARYFRYIDTKDWEALADVFTEDCVHHLPQEAPKPTATNVEYLADLRRWLGEGVTTHHGHMPEITLLGSSEAEGIWSMFDYVQIDAPDGPVNIKGYGYYYETYRKCDDGTWRISSKRNERIRLDQVAPRPDAGAPPGRGAG